MAAALFVLAAAAVTLDRGWPARPTAAADRTAQATAVPDRTPGAPTAAPSSPSPGASPTASAPVAVVSRGTGEFAYAEGQGRVLGRAGALKRFRVAVEGGIDLATPAFAASVDEVLGDGRSWIAGGRLRLQRVPAGAAVDFTIYLASPVTSERMCRSGGLFTDGYTSCRLPGKVIINSARWLTAVEGYAAPVAVYRAYAVNHEVGHELGYGHEACPGKGRPAPVMQQQTLGLKGCVANAWPYLDGRRYAGAAVP